MYVKVVNSNNNKQEFQNLKAGVFRRSDKILVFNT